MPYVGGNVQRDRGKSVAWSSVGCSLTLNPAHLECTQEVKLTTYPVLLAWRHNPRPLPVKTGGAWLRGIAYKFRTVRSPLSNNHCLPKEGNYGNYGGSVGKRGELGEILGAYWGTYGAIMGNGVLKHVQHTAV